MRRLVCICSLALLALDAHAELKSEPARPTDLSGHWVFNAAASDDAVAIANKWLSKQMRPRPERMPRGRGRNGEDDEYSIPDDEHTVREPMPEDEDSPDGRRSRRPPKINFNSERVRQILSLVPALDITQSDSAVKIGSELEVENYEPGRSQVSTIEGGLADSDIGWDGEIFSIDRRVPHGLRVVEQYRLLNHGAQLEYRLERRGEGLFSPLSLRRVYDRAAPPAAVDPNAGPSR